MKVCIVPSNDFFSIYGGAEIYVRNVIDEFCRHRSNSNISIFVISVGTQYEKKDYHGIEVFQVTNPTEMQAVLEKSHPNIVHANGLFDWIIPICNKLSIKSVVTIHDSMYMCPTYTLLDYKERLCSQQMSTHNCLRCVLGKIKCGRYAYPFVKLLTEQQYIALGKWLSKKTFRLYFTPVGTAALGINNKIAFWKQNICKADKVIQLCPRMVKMAELNGLLENKIVLLSNGVPVSHGTCHFPDFTDGIKFFYTGRICASKGIHILLSAFHKLKYANIELHIIGCANDNYALALKDKYKHDTRITWHGYIDHELIGKTIQSYHVMVHPSIANETCSLSILEALSLGKYAIATRCGGPETLIHEGINGMLAEPNSIENLFSKMQNYIEHPLPPQKIIYMSMEEHVAQLYHVYSNLTKE